MNMFFANLYPALIFRSTWVSGSMSKTNSNGDKGSPWTIPLLMPLARDLFLQCRLSVGHAIADYGNHVLGSSNHLQAFQYP